MVALVEWLWRFFWSNQPIRYLAAGGWNTLFGVGLNILLLSTLAPVVARFGGEGVGNLVALLVSALFSISMAFLTYKLIVFRTVGNWLTEYLRTYVVYGGATLISIGLTWVLVTWLGVSAWLGSLAPTVVVVISSYFGHKYFSFRKPKSATADGVAPGA